jgi:hypothetical protein
MRGFLAPAAPCSSAWPLPPAKPRTSEACARRGSRWSSLVASTRTCRDDLTRRSVRLNLGGSVYDPTDSVGRLLFNVLDLVAEFEADLIQRPHVRGHGSRFRLDDRSVERGPSAYPQRSGCRRAVTDRRPQPEDGQALQAEVAQHHHPPNLEREHLHGPGPVLPFCACASSAISSRLPDPRAWAVGARAGDVVA